MDRRRVAGCKGKTVLHYGIVNEEAWGSEGEGKNREGKGWGIGIKLFIFYFLWNSCFILKGI
jgi:hypothetical protein